MSKLKAFADQYRDVSRAIANQIVERLPQDGVLIDVGANLGVVTEEVLKQKYCTAHLFEPVPEYYRYCLQVLSDHCIISPYALGDKRETATLWLGEVNLGWNTLVTEKKTDGMRPIQVEVIPFDDYAEAYRLERIDAIKIDVEGYEYKVLRGMRKTLATFHPVLFVEIGWGEHHPQRGAEIESFEWLFANGYKHFNYHTSETMDVVIEPE